MREFMKEGKLLPEPTDTTNSFFTQQSDTSRGIILAPKEYARRKKRRQMQSYSRKQNRKH